MASRRPLDYPVFQAFDANGNPLSSGTVEFFDAGTTDQRNTYSDPELTTANPNPVTLNSRGEPQSGGGSAINIYLDNQPYKMVLKDSDGATIRTVDDYIQVPGLTDNADYAIDVKTLSDLQGIDITALSDGDSRYMKGRSSVGDGGEGHFHWDSSDLSTQVGNDEVTSSQGDGGIYIAPASDKTGASGAWVRQFNGAVNVLWYGAEGDGTTDDTNAIQAAIKGAQGKDLVFPAPSTAYLGDDTTQVDYSGVNSVTATGAVFHQHHIRIGDDCTWSGGHLDQEEGTLNQEMVKCEGSNVRIDNLRITGGLDAGESYTALEITANKEKIQITNCQLVGRSSLTVRDGKHITIDNCYVESAGDDGIVIKDVTGNTAEDIAISNIVCKNCNSILGIGDHCLSLIQNVTVTNAVGYNVPRVANIRPGKDGDGGGDCRNISLSNVVIVNDNQSLGNLVILSITDGTMENVVFDNISVNGRFTNNTSNLLVLMRAINVGDTLQNVLFTNYRYTDPNGGVANDGSNPGHPAGRISTTSNSGTLDDITFEHLYVNGYPDQRLINWGESGTCRFIGPILVNLQGTTNIFSASSGDLLIDGGDFPDSTNAASFQLTNSFRDRRIFGTKTEFYPVNTSASADLHAPVRLIPQDNPPSNRLEDGDLWIDSGNNEFRARINGATVRIDNVSGQTYSESNVSTDRTFDANSTSTEELADVLGTLIKDLRSAGIVD